MLQTCRLAGKALPVAGRALQATTLTSPFSPKAQHKSFCVWNATSAVQLSAKAHRSCLVASVGHRFTGGNSVSAVTKRFFSDSDIRVGEEYERGQQDESSTLTITPPFGHDDNETLANQLGIYKVGFVLLRLFFLSTKPSRRSDRTNNRYGSTRIWGRNRCSRWPFRAVLSSTRN